MHKGLRKQRYADEVEEADEEERSIIEKMKQPEFEARK
jgi:hypothetical protein